jgi:hypothetical protein
VKLFVGESFMYVHAVRGAEKPWLLIKSEITLKHWK